MLAKIIRMDWILNSRHILLNTGLFCLYSLYFGFRMENPRIFSLFTAIMASFGAFTVLGREDRLKTGATTISLPVDRRQVVFARYILGWAIALGTLCLIFGLALSLKSFVEVSFPLFTAGGVALGLVTVGIIMSFLFPFVIRFGWMGLVIFLVALQVLGATFFAAARYGGIRISLRAVPAAIGSWSGHVQQVLGWPLFFASLLLGLVLLTGLSILVSVTLYRRKQF